MPEDKAVVLQTGVDAELSAIKLVLDSLNKLDGAARERVLRYVLDHLEMPTITRKYSAPVLSQNSDFTSAPSFPNASLSEVRDIKTLKLEKQPQSAVEMVALAAYYLMELAPPEERKSSITSVEVEKYFKQAGFKLPNSLRHTLPNAAQAGYVDKLGSGAYKLNPVGHNLVVHTLPRSKNKT